MGPDLELTGKSEASLEALVSKESIPAPAFSGQKVLQPGSNYKGNACVMEASPIKQTLSNGNVDVEVNITGPTNYGKALVVEDACEDLTECSSSFGDTESGIENGSAFSDTEVESQMCAGNATSFMCNDLCEPFQIRKKKVTIHWRRFIRPLTWRCKWIELQLKKLRSQALKYDKELAAYKHAKQLEFAIITVDGFDVKSVPKSGQIHRNGVMKRKKRRRVEQKCDLASYISNHSLFSYYENKGSTDGDFLGYFADDTIGGDADNNEELKLNDNDKSLDDIIQKIEAVHSQVHNLKTRIDKVVSENPGKFSSVTQLGMLGPSDGFKHSDLNASCFDGNKNTFPVSFVHAPSQLKSELCMRDILMPGNTLSSCEGITPLIETAGRPQLAVSWEDTEDGVLVQNEAAKEELHDLENVRNQLVEKTKESVEEQKSISLVQVSEPDVATDDAMHSVRSSLKACSTSKSNFPRNTSRRKKYGSKRWRRR